jgi:hypothetical protein
MNETQTEKVNAMKHIRLKNTKTGKFYGQTKWDKDFSQADIIDEGGVTHLFLKQMWSMEFVEVVPVIDDSKKPVKTYDAYGTRTWKYKGHTVKAQTKTTGSYPHKKKSVTTVYIDGILQHGSGIRDAVKLIDAGRVAV